MLEIEECLLRLLNEIQPQNKTKTVPVTQCHGMILGEDVAAKMMVPPYPKSAMDGYALRAADVEGATREHPICLKVAGELLAGDDLGASWLEGLQDRAEMGGIAVRVMTGSYIPEGFDAVIRQEDTDYGEKEVAVFAAVRPYANYCKVGEDIRRGELVLPKYTRLSSLHIGLMASLGMEKVSVCEPAKIAIISTGTELMEVGQPLLPGKIYNSISHMLAAAIQKEGLLISRAEICADTEEILQESISEAVKEADMVITTGAVSVGKKDIIPAVLKNLGARELFRGADIQPGTPTMGSVLDGKVILSLSGNPYAAMANFEIYFWAAMAKMMHSPSFEVRTAFAELASEYSKVNKLRRMIRAHARDGKVTIPSQVHSSSVIRNLTECNCFIDLEAGRAVKPGDMVRIRYFKDGGES